MKNYLALFAALGLFALVWAAGHDILKGEPDVWMEWTIVVAGLGLAGAMLIRRWRAHRPVH